MSPLWSYVLAVIGITAMLLAGKKRVIAWPIGLISQIVWASYAIATRQWGFLISAIAFSAVYARNWYLWFREEQEAKNEDLRISS